MDSSVCRKLEKLKYRVKYAKTHGHPHESFVKRNARRVYHRVDDFPAIKRLLLTLVLITKLPKLNTKIEELQSANAKLRRKVNELQKEISNEEDDE